MDIQNFESLKSIMNAERCLKKFMMIKGEVF